MKLGHLCSVVCVAGLVSTGEAVQYAITDLGIGTPMRINDSGWVIVGDHLWDPVNGHRYLGSLGGGTTQAWGLNDRGEVVGFSEDGTGHLRAFYWRNDQIQDLGLGQGSSAVAINNHGEIIGASPDGHAYLMTDAEVIDLGFGTQVWDLNDNGQMLGSPGIWHGTGDGMWDAGTWTKISVIAPLSINNHTQAVGHGSMMWSPSSVIDLGDLGVGRRINDQMQFVGDDLFGRASLWQEGVLYDLNSLIAPDSRWFSLAGAMDINNRGQIVGYGFLHEGDTETHAFLLNPIPEPASLALFSCAVATLRRRSGRVLVR
jgi:probable HAF family extracellular repeat protein